ncbi:DUF169 domain-containing protein [Corallococcus carmarthensis]|uniref:Uncharacterized protein n=1 Tax=Corallococcus carmarthensis TaxID=2316728 RepID=A0A3A8JPI8_9BACT|nr:DUF169 domain-containing protein [Corallococcus carmarthensis]RKG97667.1 hypothetical protein D7X32_32040 [Corallococcus carmarthensis]
MSWSEIQARFVEHLALVRLPVAVTHGGLPPEAGANIWPAGPTDPRLPCMVAMINQVEPGRPLLLDEAHPPMDCGAFYSGLSDALPERCCDYVVETERYVRDAATFMASVRHVTAPRQQGPLVFRVLADLRPDETPDLVLFWVDADQLSVIHTLANFESAEGDRVISPWGAACNSLYSLPLKELHGEGRAVLGSFDPSQRLKGHVRDLSLAVPRELFLRMVGHLEIALTATPMVARLLRGDTKREGGPTR